MMNNPKDMKFTQEQWMKLIARLSPTALKNLEESLRVVQKTGPVSESGRSSPSPSSIASVGFKRGKTFENGRRDLKNEPVSEEESERRSKRRERNRMAAAKCRRRRQDQIDTLQSQVMRLRKRQNDLQSALTVLGQQRGQLRSTIRQHQCQLKEQQQRVENQTRDNYYPNNNENIMTEQDLVQTDGIVNMELEISEVTDLTPFYTATKVEPTLDIEAIRASVADNYTDLNGNPPLASLSSRPSSLPLPPPQLSGAPLSAVTMGMTRMSPLLTPSTINFLNSNQSNNTSVSLNNISDIDTNANPVTSEFNQVYQSIGYLNLLSPSFDTHSSSNFNSSSFGYNSNSLDAIPQLHTPNGSVF